MQVLAVSAEHHHHLSGAIFTWWRLHAVGGVFSHAVAVIRQSDIRKNPYLVNVS